MKTVAYDKAKLMRTAVGCPILGILGLMCLARVGTFLAVVILIGAVMLLTLGVLGARKLFGDRTALRYDRDRLTIVTMWSENSVQWRDVAEVGTSALNSYAFYGLIKVASTKYLHIKMKGGFLGKKYRLLSDMFDLDKAGLAALVDDLAAHQFAAIGAPVPHAADKMARLAVSAPQAEVFDPDAAFANYMRRRKESVEPPPPVPAPSFGRRDILEGAPRTPIAGARAGGFGRKMT